MDETKRNECLGELNAPTQAMMCAIGDNHSLLSIRNAFISEQIVLIEMGEIDESSAIQHIGLCLVAEAIVYDLTSFPAVVGAILDYGFDAIDFCQIARLLLDENRRKSSCHSK